MLLGKQCFLIYRPKSRIHKSHGGHNAISIRLTGGRNEQEGTLGIFD